MLRADVDVTLWQKSSVGTVFQRKPDGFSLILQDNVFTITHGRVSDLGNYYCRAGGSSKFPAGFVTFAAGKMLSFKKVYEKCGYFLNVRTAFDVTTLIHEVTTHLQ